MVKACTTTVVRAYVSASAADAVQSHALACLGSGRWACAGTLLQSWVDDDARREVVSVCGAFVPSVWKAVDRSPATITLH